MTPAAKLEALARLRRSRSLTPEERHALADAIAALAAREGLPVPKDEP